MVKYKYSYIFIAVFISFSCSSPNENDLPLVSPEMSTPVVTGLFITKAGSIEIIGVWGIPSDYSPAAKMSSRGLSDSECTTSIQGKVSVIEKDNIVIPLPNINIYHNPYPNPSSDSCVFIFYVPKQAIVSLWAVRARWVGEKDNNLTLSGGATTVSAQKTATIFIHNQSVRAGGHHEIRWNWRDQIENPVSPGFYRVYLRVDQDLYWHDVLLYRDVNELPSDLRLIIEH